MNHILTFKNQPTPLIKFDSNEFNDFLECQSLDEKVKLLILRDLLRLNWGVNFIDSQVVLKPPTNYNKETIKSSMSIKRQEIIKNNYKWINTNIDLARENLATGESVLKSNIEPIIEICSSPKQHKLFRIFRYFWSSPYSEYVGRRIKILIRDNAISNKPIIGIAALGSSIIHIPERDDFIGWDIKTRTKNLIYTMDAYVLGSLPPYSYLLGGKLISYMMVSNEIREIFHDKYKNVTTRINKRKSKDLACLFTTSLYGRSSQYNRLKFNDKLLFRPIGETKGYGTLHLTEETFNAMVLFLRSKNILISNNFGDGPIWRMRVIRSVSDLLGFDPDFLLKHSFKRKIYVIPLANNYLEYLNDRGRSLSYFNISLEELITYWKNRWFYKRIKREDVKNNVIRFDPKDFNIL